MFAHAKESTPHRAALAHPPPDLVVVCGAGPAAVATAAAHPRARIVIFAPTWRDVDETRALAAPYGDRVTVHHQSARGSPRGRAA